MLNVYRRSSLVLFRSIDLSLVSQERFNVTVKKIIFIPCSSQTTERIHFLMTIRFCLCSPVHSLGREHALQYNLLNRILKVLTTMSNYQSQFITSASSTSEITTLNLKFPRQVLSYCRLSSLNSHIITLPIFSQFYSYCRYVKPPSTRTCENVIWDASKDLLSLILFLPAWYPTLVSAVLYTLVFLQSLV